MFLAESVFKRDWLTHNKSIWADPLVEENGDNEQLEWSAPEVVQEYDRLVKPAKNYCTQNQVKQKYIEK